MKRQQPHPGPMLRYAESPDVLLADIADQISQVREPHARHWLVTPGRGRSEHVLNEWARRTGIASHAQEVQLRTLLEQISAGAEACFDFDALRLAVAGALEGLQGHQDFPFPRDAQLAPVTAAVLAWATTLARVIDETLQCREGSAAWARGSFLEALVAAPAVAEVLQTHPSLLSPGDFGVAASRWVEAWERKGGVPYLWIQLDAGLPALSFNRLQQTLEFFRTKGLSERIRLFAIVPSAEYWSEQLVRSRNRHAGTPELATEQHPGGLLWALGRCSQDFQRQMVEPLFSEGTGGEQIPSPPCADSLLGWLQESCRRSAPPEERQTILPRDCSLSVHSAHNPLRELEICRDRILQALEEVPDLRAEEILVLLANPKEQAVYVEAAFGGAGEASLPFRLLGFGQAIPSPFAAALELLTSTLGGRLSLAEVQRLLEHPLVAQRFGLDVAEGEASRLVDWLRDAGFRWGIDAKQRSAVHEFEEERWNLSWAVQRLGLGGLVSQAQREQPLGETFQHFATVPMERASGLGLALLAKLAGFLDALQRNRPHWTPGVERPLSEWNHALERLIEDFLFVEEPSAAAHAGSLRNGILPMLQRTAGKELLLETGGYVSLVQEKLQNLNDSANRGGGCIRIGDLRQMCGVPARLVVVAGLNCDSFPRREDRPAWHPLTGVPQPGDPSVRDADRHALLLALLSARERVVLSFCGGSDEDQKERPPSTALADILEAIDATARAGDDKKPAHHAILHRHPLNGCSIRAFALGVHPCSQGRAPSDHSAALHLRERDSLRPYPGPWSTLLPEEGTARPSLEDLRTLLTEPARLFLRRLGIRAPEEGEEAAALDLIELNALEEWAVRQELLFEGLEGGDRDRLKHRLLVSGRLPRAKLGEAVLEKIESELPATTVYAPGDRIATTCRIALPGGVAGGDQIVLEGIPRTGWYRKAGGSDLHYYSASKFDAKASIRQALLFRLEALAIAATVEISGEIENVRAEDEPFLPPAANGQVLNTATGIFREERHTLALPAAGEAAALLEQLLPLYRLARRVPLPFWPQAAFKIKALAGTAPEERTNRLEAAREEWLNGGYNSPKPPESKVPATRIAFRGLDDPLAWTPAWAEELADFLPDPGAPLAWRLARFMADWLGAPPPDAKPKTSRSSKKK
jgi:exonuclease V gamma subunit